MNPSGGLRWHWKAWRSQKLWEPTCQDIASWLAQTPAQRSELLLIGASAGWMMSSAWLAGFRKVTTYDIDPLAAPLFRWRHGKVLAQAGTQLVCQRGDALNNLADVLQEHRQALAGESWSQGQIILSWEDALKGALHPADGRNVVIHEFAHQLDQENGTPRGAPPPLLGDTEHDPQRWAAVFQEAYGHLQGQAFMGEQGLLSHYGAQDPAEFFAVVSEVFFEQASLLVAQHPALYRELCGYYKVDPATWE